MNQPENAEVRNTTASEEIFERLNCTCWIDPLGRCVVHPEKRDPRADDDGAYMRWCER